MKKIILLLLIILVISTCSCSTNQPNHLKRMEDNAGYNIKDLIAQCQAEQHEKCYPVVLSLTMVHRMQKAMKAYNLLEESI